MKKKLKNKKYLKIFKKIKKETRKLQNGKAHW